MAGAEAIVAYLQDLGLDRAAEPTLPGTPVREQEARVGDPGTWQLWLFSWHPSAVDLTTRYWEIRATDVGPTTKVLAIGLSRDVMLSTWSALYAELLGRAAYSILQVIEQ